MSDAFNEAYGIVQCKECPWYKSCVVPRQMESTSSGVNASSQPDLGMQNLLSSMASAAQNSLLEGCPVFIDRLRSSPELARRVKEMMQNWGKEDNQTP